MVYSSKDYESLWFFVPGCRPSEEFLDRGILNGAKRTKEEMNTAQSMEFLLPHGHKNILQMTIGIKNN